MKNRVFKGYLPGAGEWYPAIVYPRPTVYHKYAKQDVYDILYPDLVTDDIAGVADFKKAIDESIDGVADVKLTKDIDIPLNADGSVTTTIVKAGKTLNVDLNGHELKCVAFAFYVNGGTLNISDSKGTGKIVATDMKKANPVLFATGETASINMTGGLIDTTSAVKSSYEDQNWTYGVTLAKNAKFNMTGGTIHTADASCVTVANTDGGQFIGSVYFHIGGDAKLITDRCAAIYMASEESLVIDGNATIDGGIIARMGHITIGGNAKVTNKKSYTPLGNYAAASSGVDSIEFGFLGMTGTYTTEDKQNDLALVIKDNATISNSAGREDVGIAKIETKYDQKVTVDIASKDISYKVYEHDELAKLATEAGKSLAAKKATVDCTVTVAGEKVYPVEEKSEETTTDDTKTEA